jgi:hypothetical protein
MAGLYIVGTEIDSSMRRSPFHFRAIACWLWWVVRRPAERAVYSAIGSVSGIYWALQHSWR